MSETVQLILIGIIVLITNFQEGITGFGCTALALPFVALLLGDVELAKHILVPIAYMLAFAIVIMSRKQIVWREYWRIVLLAGIGLPIGMWISKSLPKEGMQWLLAVFFTLIGIHGMIREASRKGKQAPATGLKKTLLSGIVPLGGVMQGAFGSGGPLVVVYATRALVDKGGFRVTLCMVWVTLNTILLADWIRDPRYHAINIQATRAVLICMPFTIAGLVLGNFAHHRVNETVFRRMVYAVLSASGMAMAWSLLRK
jgi:uncharacterized membrane protein YfcA